MVLKVEDGDTGFEVEICLSFVHEVVITLGRNHSSAAVFHAVIVDSWTYFQSSLPVYHIEQWILGTLRRTRKRTGDARGRIILWLIHRLVLFDTSDLFFPDVMKATIVAVS